ncbi:MAG: proton-conducting transporter membrane subunit [Phycisphaerae bacterium]|nr:proton-conducting transporter membrane subunit [Phycisphaerae bacterium]
MVVALFLVPALAGIAAFFIRPHGPRRALLPAVAVAHASLTGLAWLGLPAPALQGLLKLDELGLLFLSITSALFLVASFYAVGYLKRETPDRRPDFEQGFLFDNIPEAVFIGCLLLFLAMMTLVSLSAHVGLMWVAVEATTLASAPLIYFHRHHRSLEAAWKYLLICSVGIALALLGIFFLAVAAADVAGTATSLLMDDLVRRGAALNRPWLSAAFIFLLVGYGTKMGLAPLHTWLPDAHSESPSVVSALLSGALLNCAFLGILRAHQVLTAAGCAVLGQELLVLLGLVSMGTAAVFIIGQQDYKRLLAYSSVEHIGILALGVGLGGAGVFGSMLHAVNHSLTKAMLFLVAGNLLAVYNSKSCRDVRGALRVMPFSAALWIAGFLAITGSPPFGPFLSEFTVLKAALDQGRAVVAILYLGCLGIIFVGMASVFVRMTQGQASLPMDQPRAREPLLSVIPPAVLGVLVLCLGVHVPTPLNSLLHRAAQMVGGS